MKSRIAVMVILLVAGSMTYGQKVKISGEVSDEINSVTLKAYNSKSLSYEEVVKASVSNGNFLIREKLETPNLFKIDFSGKKSAVLSITDEKEIEVNFVNEKVEIIGSEESEAMLSFEQENGKLQAKHFAQLKKDADVAMASGDKEAMAKIQERSAAAIQAFLPELRQWIIDQGVGPAGYRAIEFSDFNKELDFIETRLEAFQNEIPDSPLTKALALRVYRSKVISIGKIPPAIETLDKDGEPFDLKDYNGKVLLVDFWAAWCRACRIENPQFAKLYQKFKGQGFEVVSISQDETKEAWQKAIAKDGVGIWRHIWDREEVITDLYGVSSLPQNVVLGRNGTIIGKNVNAEQLEKLLAKSL